MPFYIVEDASKYEEVGLSISCKEESKRIRA